MATHKKHLGFMAFSTYFRIGSQLLVFLLLARMLGVENFGQFSYWFSIGTIICIPINYGFGTQLLRESAKYPEKLSSILSNMFTAKLALTILIVICSLLSVYYISKIYLFLALLSVAISESYIDFYNNALRSQGHYSVEARITFVSSVLQLIIMSLTTLFFTDLQVVSIVYFMCRLLALAMTVVAIKSYLGFSCKSYKFKDLSFKDTLLSGFPYAADIGVSTLNNTIDVIMLKHLTDVQTVGIYQAGMRLLMGGVTPATIVSNVYLPRVSSLDCGSYDYGRIVVDVNMKMVAVGGFIALVMAVFSNNITNLLFGTGYKNLALLLPWFSLVLILRYVAASFGINLTASGHQSVRVTANIVYLAVFIISAFLLIPLYNSIGVLIAGTCSVMVLAIIYSVYVKLKRLPSGFNFLTSSLFIFIISIIVYCIHEGAM